MRIEGRVLRVQGLGFKGYGSAFRIRGLRFRVWHSEVRVES